jgi:hypothetical protein
MVNVLPSAYFPSSGVEALEALDDPPDADDPEPALDPADEPDPAELAAEPLADPGEEPADDPDGAEPVPSPPLLPHAAMVNASTLMAAMVVSRFMVPPFEGSCGREPASRCRYCLGTGRLGQGCRLVRSA